MATYSYTNTLTNGATADADEVMANFNDVRNFLNADGSGAATMDTDNYLTKYSRHSFDITYWGIADGAALVLPAVIWETEVTAGWQPAALKWTAKCYAIAGGTMKLLLEMDNGTGYSSIGTMDLTTTTLSTGTLSALVQPAGKLRLSINTASNHTTVLGLAVTIYCRAIHQSA